jgi:hypothetical protein
VSDKTGWHWSPWVGVCYGNIPVGLLVAGAAIVVIQVMGVN